MWLFTPDGYYSIVQKPQDRKKGMLTIRTRNRADMDALVARYLPRAKPYRVRHSDYEWRIRVPQKAWARAVSKMALDIDYSNFKDEVTRWQGTHRHDVYLRVWQTLLALSDRWSKREREEWVQPTLPDFDLDYLDDTSEVESEPFLSLS